MIVSEVVFTLYIIYDDAVFLVMEQKNENFLRKSLQVKKMVISLQWKQN